MPSLTRLSPSRIETIRRGRLSLLSTSVAARESVGERIAPSVNEPPHESCGIAACATTATPQVVAKPGEERRRVEERRQDRDEDDVRGELDARQPRHEAEQQPAADEQHRHG